MPSCSLFYRLFSSGLNISPEILPNISFIHFNLFLWAFFYDRLWITDHFYKWWISWKSIKIEDYVVQQNCSVDSRIICGGHWGAWVCHHVALVWFEVLFSDISESWLLRKIAFSVMLLNKSKTSIVWAIKLEMFFFFKEQNSFVLQISLDHDHLEGWRPRQFAKFANRWC